MADVLLFLTICMTCVWFVAPRIFRMADTQCARRRFDAAAHTTAVIRIPSSQHEATIDQFFDSLARSIRSHIPARDALMQHGALMPATPLWASFLDKVNGTMPLPMLLAQLQQQGDDIALLFAVTFSHGTFHPEALERAAHIVRDRHHLDQALMSSAAHARLTLRILSALPFAAFAVSASVSSSVRALCTSTAFVFIIFVGVLLNRAGAWWVSLLIRRATQKNTSAQSIALMESLSVSVQSGHTLAECCMLWQHVNDLGAQVAQLVRDGSSLSDALRPMRTTNDSFDALVANTLLSAQHDGLPIRSTAALLASEARKVLRAEVDTGIRQLPTRLSLPLVLCVLPSFALLVIAPLLITQLSRFGSFLPPSLS